MGNSSEHRESKSTKSLGDAPPSSITPADPVGKQIGDYTFSRKIGQGGMAIVYEARQKSLDRNVAIKIITGDFSEEPEYLERFRREARAAANLNHPHIVAIHESGQWGNNYYYVMDYVQGKTIDELIENKKHELLRSARSFSIEETLQMIEQAAQALAYAHKSGVIHRDIKPSNLLIDDKTSRVLITDFGLARSKRWEKITPRASLFGTPAYMSPEQAQGKEVDLRTDIYSLGAVLYEMLTGECPYPGENALQVIEKVKTEPLASPTKLNPTVPAAVESMIFKAMSKDIQLRYQSMDELLVDIQKFRSGLRISTFIEIAKHRVGKKKKITLAVLYTLIGILSILAVSFWWFYLNEVLEERSTKRQLELAHNYEVGGLIDEARQIYIKIIHNEYGTEYSQIARKRLEQLEN